MNDLNVVDRFMAAFIRYIDSGFGLLGGDVGFLTTTLIGIDITLAGLFWAMGGEQDVIGRFIKKILYIGAFAFIINQFSTLADIIFRSFATAGLTAGGGTMSADDLLKPGRLAGVGFSAAWPLLQQISDLTGPVAFFTNFMTIAVLLIAWALTIITFFILAVQVFVTIIEFKLTTLAGFVLVPFALWNRTSFLAERVLGNVVSSGIKVMVLAVIIGISSNFFADFTAASQGQEPDLAQALSLVLASLTLFGLGISGRASLPVWCPALPSSELAPRLAPWPARRASPRLRGAPPSAQPVPQEAPRSERSAPARQWVRRLRPPISSANRRPAPAASARGCAASVRPQPVGSARRRRAHLASPRLPRAGATAPGRP